MTQIESMQTITKRFRSEGKSIGEAVAEWNRQGREVVRERESAILADADRPGGEHLSEFAQQIRDHRAAGNYTTQG